jgi:hypothetical protein
MNRQPRRFVLVAAVALITTAATGHMLVAWVADDAPATASTLTYPIVDTGQAETFDSVSGIVAPRAGQPFYGQDAQHNGNPSDYVDNSDATVTDRVTG